MKFQKSILAICLSILPIQMMHAHLLEYFLPTCAGTAAFYFNDPKYTKPLIDQTIGKGMEFYNFVLRSKPVKTLSDTATLKAEGILNKLPMAVMASLIIYFMQKAIINSYVISTKEDLIIKLTKKETKSDAGD